MGTADFFFQARVGGFAGAEDLDFAVFEAEIGGLLVGVKIVAVLDDVIVEAGKIFEEIARGLAGGTAVAARPVVRPIEAPIERTDYAVVVYPRELGLPVVHPLSVARGHLSSRNTAMGRDWRLGLVQWQDFGT